MAVSILSSPRAIEMSVFVVRAFVRLRDASTTQRELVARLKAIERQVGKHDGELATILTTLEQLIAPPLRKRRHIGFLD